MDFKCVYCNKEFLSDRALRGHLIQKHKTEYYEAIDNSNVVVGGDVLDITTKDLRELRERHDGRCDICGKHETANTRPDVKSTPNRLCIDHNHNTNEFRGFICVQCNRNMGWLDKFSEQIITYNKSYKSKVKK